jgi:hypothetical protein
MRRVKRVLEDPKLFEQLLLTRSIALIAGHQKNANVFYLC